MKKILLALTSHDRLGDTGKPTGFYLPEAAHPWAILKTAGFAVDFVSPQGGQPPMVGADATDPASRQFLDDSEVAAQLADTPLPAQVNAADYAAILFVGGHGTMWDFPDDQGLARLAVAIHEAGGVLAAVCHGPAALLNLRLADGRYLVHGKQVAAFSDEEERAVQLADVVPFLLAEALRQRGAEHCPAPPWQAKVVVDGRLVTGQNPASAEGVGRAMLRLLQAGAG